MSGEARGQARWVRYGSAEELAPLADDETSIRILGDLDEAAHHAVARLIATRPSVGLVVERGEDVEALRWYPGLRNLTVTSLKLRTLDGLRHVANSLERLYIGDTISKVSLRPVAQLDGLRRLGVRGTWKDPDALSALTRLERLSIGSIDLELLRPMTQLARLESGLGTIRGMDVLPEIGRLELVELYRLRGPHDLTALGRISTLRYLVLESTRSITTLPSFSESRELRWIALEEMRGITDLRPIADAPNLEVLLLIGMRQLDAESLRPLLGHPRLRVGVWGFGSDRRNFAAQDLVPLPPEPYGYATARRSEPESLEPAPWNQPDWDGIRHPIET